MAQAAAVAAMAIAALTAAAAPSGAERCSGEASFDQETDTTVPVYGRAFMLWVDDEGQYVGGGRNMGDDSPDNDGFFEAYVDDPTVDNNFGPAPASPQCVTVGSLPGPGSLPGTGPIPAVPSDLVAGEPTTTTTTSTSTSTTTTTSTTPAATPAVSGGDGDRAVVLGARASRSSGTALARTGGDIAETVALGAAVFGIGAAFVLLARLRSARN